MVGDNFVRRAPSASARKGNLLLVNLLLGLSVVYGIILDEYRFTLDLRRDDQNGEVWTIKAGGVVGAINAGTLVVMLLPKFPLMPILMADYVRSRGNQPGDVHLRMEDSKLCYFILAG